MQTVEYGPGGVFAIAKYGKYQHRFKVDMDDALLWPLCHAKVEWVRWWSSYRSEYTPMCPRCEHRYREAQWLPIRETRRP